MTPNEAYIRLSERIHKLRVQDKRLRLFGLAALGVAFLLFFLVLLLVSESFFWFNVTIRSSIAAVFISIIIVIILLLTGYSIRCFIIKKKMPADDTLASRIGKTFPALHDRMMNSLQVYREREHYGTSPELAEATLIQIAAESESLDLMKALRKRFFSFGWKTLILIFCIAMILSGLFPDPIKQAGMRLLHPKTTYVKPQPFYWVISPGDAGCVQGDSVMVSICAEGNMPATATLIIEDESVRSEKELSVPGFWTFNAIQNNITYSVRSGSVQSPIYRLTVQKRPVVRRLLVTVMPPAYSKHSKYIQDPNVGDIEALTGSQVHIRFTASKPIRSGALRFQNNRSMSVNVNAAEGHAQFTIQQNDTYFVGILDTDSLSNRNPITYTIKASQDLKPVARILFPGQNTDMDENMKLPLELEAEDDYGLSSAQIGYQIIRGGNPSAHPLDTVYMMIAQDTMTTRFHHTLIWDVDGFGLWPEDIISYFFEVHDNDAVSGPKISRSETYFARFPSMAEIFKEVTEAQDEHLDEMAHFAEEQKAIKEQVDQMAEDIKAGREITWEKKQQLAETLEKQRLDQKVEAFEKQLQEISDQLERNDLISVETLEKYQELQELYGEMATPEMQQAMQQLQEALKNMDETQLQQAMQNMQINQEILKQSIERTLALLRQIQVEQKLEALANQLNNLAERQTEINESLNQDHPDHQKLSRDENKISEDASNVEKAMDDLREKMGELPHAPMDQMQAMADSLQSDPLSGQTLQMENMLKQQNPQSVQTGQQIAQNMMSMSQSLNQMQTAMENQRQQKSKEGLRKTSFQLLQLSQSQEQLMQSMQQGSTENRGATETQASMISGIQQVSDSLYQLSRQNFQISPEMGRSLSKAQNQMEQAARAMQQFGNRGVAQHQTNAMGALNEAAAELQNTLGQMQGGGMGIDQFMMQLGQMGQEQMALQRQLMDMLNQGALSLQQQAGMARMAARQQALQKQLQDMMQQMGERSDIAGRLGNLAKEMEEIIKELEENAVSSKTIQRQKKIISRLLDAQHSLHKQDISREREARAGEDFNRQSPDALRFDQPGWKNRIRQELLRLKDAGYTQDYQKLIRDYFEALTREEIDGVK